MMRVYFAATLFLALLLAACGGGKESHVLPRASGAPTSNPSPGSTPTSGPGGATPTPGPTGATPTPGPGGAAPTPTPTPAATPLQPTSERNSTALSTSGATTITLGGVSNGTTNQLVNAVLTLPPASLPSTIATVGLYGTLPAGISAPQLVHPVRASALGIASTLAYVSLSLTQPVTWTYAPGVNLTTPAAPSGNWYFLYNNPNSGNWTDPFAQLAIGSSALTLQYGGPAPPFAFTANSTYYFAIATTGANGITTPPPTPTPTPVPTPTPTPSPTPVPPIVASPSTLTFLAMNVPPQSFTVTGAFPISVVNSSSCLTSAFAQISSLSQTPGSPFTVTPLTPGSCTFTLHDGIGQTTTVTINIVTTTVIGQ